MGHIVYSNAVLKELGDTKTSTGNATVYLWVEDNGEPGVKVDNIDSRGARIVILLDRRIEADQQYHLEYSPSEVISGMLFYRLTIDNEVINGKVIYNKQY